MKKQAMLRFIFTIEVMVFGWFYLYGTNGFLAVRQLKQESDVIEKQIQITLAEIQELQKNIVAWQADPFYTEQFARENLHMAREKEQVYCWQ